MLDVHIALSAAGMNLILVQICASLCVVEISQEVKSGTGSEVSEVTSNSRVYKSKPDPLFVHVHAK